MTLGLIDELSEPSDSDGAFVDHFFCQNMDSNANTAVSILRGLIYGLGQKRRQLMCFLKDKFNSPDDVKTADLNALWTIFSKMIAGANDLGLIYLVVDALDECLQEEEVLPLLDLAARVSFGPSVKWLFTSRQSPRFRRSIGTGAKACHVDLDTAEEVEKSVNKFIDMAVENNQELTPVQKHKILEFMRPNAEKTFLYVSLIWEDLRAASDLELSKRLSELARHSHGSSVYRVYGLMMEQVKRRDEESGSSTLQDVLEAVLLASRPLSLLELAIAAGLPPELCDTQPDSGGTRKIAEFVQQCGHILHVSEDRVSLIHKSAKDYLMAGGDGDAEAPFLPSQPLEQHARIAKRCLLALLSTIRTPDFSTMEALQDQEPSGEYLQRIRDSAYVYCSWHHHVLESGDQFTEASLITDFFQKKFLGWVEAMGYLGKLRHCIAMIQELSSAVCDIQGETRQSPSIEDYLDDSFQFLIRHQHLIQAHPTQVYFLAMYFTPKCSLTRENSRQRVPCALKIYEDPPETWTPCRFTIDVSGYQWGEKDHRKATKARYSSSGFDLAGNNRYYSYTSRDFRLAFSGDGKTISIGSSTLGRNILRFNASDGSFAGSFDAHEDGIVSSNDARLFVSVSSAGLGVWDVERNCLRSRLEHRHSGSRVVAAKFSSDGSMIAVVFKRSVVFRSRRYHLQVWDTATGLTLHETQLADGSRVRDLAFTCSSSLLAVLSEKAIVLLDVETGKWRETPTAAWSEPNAAAFSEDGSIVAVATRRSVAFYEVDPFTVIAEWPVTRNSYSDEIETYSSRPNFGMEIAVSAKRKTAAVTFRTFIVFFDLTASPIRPVAQSTRTYRRAMANEEFFHSKLPIIDALAFSPCGTYLACARNDDLVSIWDVHASLQPPVWTDAVLIGTATAGPRPMSSPDGRLCGTWIRTKAYLWEVATASVKIEFRGRPNVGFQDLRLQVPNSIAWVFSPDSTRAITVMSLTLYLVNTRDWTHVEISLPGKLTAMAFNPQSTLFALSTHSTEETRILLFDAASGSSIFSHAVSCNAIHAITFSCSGTLVAAGEDAKGFVYHVWEGPDYNREDEFKPSRCFSAPWHKSDTDQQIVVERITGMAFSTNDTLLVVIVTSVFTMLEPRSYIGVQTIALADPPQFGSLKPVAPAQRMFNYIRIEARGHDNYYASFDNLDYWRRADRAGIPLTSLRLETGREVLSAAGVVLALPEKENRKTTRGLRYEEADGSVWVVWKGHRVLRFPAEVVWMRHDPLDMQDVLANDPARISFLSIETPAEAEPTHDGTDP